MAKMEERKQRGARKGNRGEGDKGIEKENGRGEKEGERREQNREEKRRKSELIIRNTSTLNDKEGKKKKGREKKQIWGRWM